MHAFVAERFQATPIIENVMQNLLFNSLHVPAEISSATKNTVFVTGVIFLGAQVFFAIPKFVHGFRNSLINRNK